MWCQEGDGRVEGKEQINYKCSEQNDMLNEGMREDCLVDHDQVTSLSMEVSELNIFQMMKIKVMM